MISEDKELVWLRSEVKTPPFSVGARREAGLLLRQLQRGVNDRCLQSGGVVTSYVSPTMTRRGESIYRIDDDAIVIWEIFAKKDRTTPQHVIDICKKRIKEYDAL